MRRLVIQTQDIQVLLSVSAGYARKIIREIKETVGKDKHQPVSIREFATYVGLDYEDVLNEVNGAKKAS